MSDLRQRIAEVIGRPLTAREAASGEWSSSIRTNAALSVFAEWLRERAEQDITKANALAAIEGHNPFETAHLTTGAITLNELADEISPEVGRP